MRRAPILEVDPLRPNPRKIGQAIDVLNRSGVIAYPTDTVYGIGCDLHDRKAIDRIYRIKGLERGHRLSFLCEDLSNIAEYAYVTDFAYRWLRKIFPGPYTAILPASRTVPKILLEKRREVGIRIPDNPTCLALTKALGRPITTTSATDPKTNEILIDASDVQDRLGRDLDLILGGGVLTAQTSTVVSFIDDQIEILREGKGPIDIFSI